MKLVVSCLQQIVHISTLLHFFSNLLAFTLKSVFLVLFMYRNVNPLYRYAIKIIRHSRNINKEANDYRIISSGFFSRSKDESKRNALEKQPGA